MRIALSLMLTPLFPVLLFILVPAILEGEFMKPNEIFLISAPTYFVTLISLVIVGLPACHYLKMLNALNIFSLSAFGALGGVVYFSIFGWLFSVVLGSSFTLDTKSIIWGASLGLTTAVVFGAVSGITRRSSKDALTRAA